MQIKEINVFTNGDALKLSTWSNFPYFFTETLEEKGIKVNRINTQPNKIFKTIYRFTIWQILKQTKKYDTYDYYRTNINRFFVNKMIKDKSGVLWLATNKGLSFFSQKNNKINNSFQLHQFDFNSSKLNSFL